MREIHVLSSAGIHKWVGCVAGTSWENHSVKWQWMSKGKKKSIKCPHWISTSHFRHYRGDSALMGSFLCDHVIKSFITVKSWASRVGQANASGTTSDSSGKSGVWVDNFIQSLNIFVMQMCVIDLSTRICRVMGGRESWGTRLSVQVRSSALNNQRGLTTNWCCKSAHVNHTNLLLPAVLVAKMTNQPLCEWETSETQCRMEIWCCWYSRCSQAPPLSLPVRGTVLYMCVGGMLWAQAGFLSTPLLRDTMACTTRKPGTLEELTNGTFVFLITWL